MAAGLAESKEEHDGRERALSLPIAVVNPEPVIPVMHGRKGARRPFLAAVNPHDLRAALFGRIEG